MTDTTHETGKLSPKFFFLSLGVLVTLITSVVSFLNLIFETLNKQFPDALNATYQYGYSSWNYDSLRGAIATLIIVFPVFLLLSYFWRKASKMDLGKIDSVIRKWMIYLVIFLAGIVIIVDLVTLVKYFVSGEITTRFILKVVSTLVVAGLAGSYYMIEMKQRMVKVLPVVFALVSAAIVVVSVVLSFGVIGSPKEQRAWRLDERRTQDLQSIQWQVISVWQQKEKLPETLKDLSNPLSGFMVPVDPEFEKGLTYEYLKKSDLTFELCATFSATMPKGWLEYGNSGGGVIPMYSERDVAMSYPYPGGTGNDSWDHEAGRTCFERTIDKDMYPPFPKDQRAY